LDKAANSFSMLPAWRMPHAPHTGKSGRSGLGEWLVWQRSAKHVDTFHVEFVEFAPPFG
jgi:hypothetical protein